MRTEMVAPSAGVQLTWWGMGTTGHYGNWVWNTEHPVYGPALVHEITDSVISFVITPHKRGHAQLFYEGHHDEPEQDIDFGTNMYADWAAAASWCAAREGVNNLDELVVAVRQLWSAYFKEKV